MAEHDRGDSEFAGDRLPPGQKPILTSSVRRFIAFMGLITDPKKGYSTMGLVTGDAGLGKTVAIQAYLDDLEPRTHTSLPAVTKIQIKPRSTPKALAVDIAAMLRDEVRGGNIYQVADSAAYAIDRNDLECLVVDEADRLNEDSFEVLRYLFDKSGCPVVVVGLPSIESVIDRHEKFKSRVGLRMEFMPVKREELLSLVLPNLVFPCWQFNHEDEADYAMGERICAMVGTSLRKLRNLLQIASQTAQFEGAPRITLEMITEAFRWSASREDKQRLRNSGAKVDNQPENEHTEYEDKSERRRNAKKR
jgi:DNA transposition AAA+ family ATPase